MYYDNSYERTLAKIGAELLERIEKEDGEIYIKDKTGFAYTVFNIFDEDMPETLHRKLKQFD